MELGKHIGKGLWGIADKALPVIYGVNYVALVIRTLPAEEFGNFVLIQEVYLVVSALTMALALSPLLKFTSEDHADHRSLLGASMHLHALSLIATSLLLVGARRPIATLLNSAHLADLLWYVPALLAVSFFRNTTLILLQARFRMQEIFWVDVAHFLGAPILTMLALWMNIFHSALDLIIINMISLSLSSLVGIVVTRSMLGADLRPNISALKRFWEYGRYAFGGQVSFLFYNKADSFILSAFSGPVPVAAYNAVKVFVRLFDMIAQVIQTFVMPAVSKLASRGEDGQLKVIAEKAIMFATMTMVPFLVLFLLLAPVLVSFYGDKYAEAALFLRLIAFVALTVPVTHVASSALMGLGDSKTVFELYLKILVCAVIAYLVFIPWLNALGAAIGYTVTSVVFAWLSARALRRRIPVTLRGTLQRTYDVLRFVQTRLDSLKDGYSPR